MNEYYCTVDYRTRGGSPGQYSATIEADSIEQANETARIQCVRRRKPVKVDGGSCVLIKQREQK